MDFKSFWKKLRGWMKGWDFPRYFFITFILILAGWVFLSFRVLGSKSSGENCIQSRLLSDQQESEDSQKIGNGVIAKQEGVTRIPFLSLSSSIIPIGFPVPGGYYIMNIDINQVFFAVLFRLTYDLIIDPLVDYLIEDWNENSRKTQFVFFLKDIVDRSRLLQIDCIEYLSIYEKILQGPPYYSDWVKKEELLHQEKNRLNWNLQFRSSGPVKMLFTRHGPIYVYSWIKDKAMRRKIKKRSQFETKKVRRFFYKNYRDLLDAKLPLGGMFELDPSFKKSIQQSVDLLPLRSQPILGGKDSLRVRGLNVNLFFDPTNKEIKIENCESKTDESLVDCFVGVVRFKLTDPNQIKLPGPQPNNLGLWIRFGFEQRENLTLRRKFCVVLIIWYYYRNRRYFY